MMALPAALERGRAEIWLATVLLGMEIGAASRRGGSGSGRALRRHTSAASASWWRPRERYGIAAASMASASAGEAAAPPRGGRGRAAGAAEAPGAAEPAAAAATAAPVAALAAITVVTPWRLLRRLLLWRHLPLRKQAPREVGGLGVGMGGTAPLAVARGVAHGSCGVTGPRGAAPGGRQVWRALHARWGPWGGRAAMERWKAAEGVRRRPTVRRQWAAWAGRAVPWGRGIPVGDGGSRGQDGSDSIVGRQSGRVRHAGAPSQRRSADPRQRPNAAEGGGG